MNAKLVVSFAALTVLASLACSTVTLAEWPCEARGNDIRCLARNDGPDLTSAGSHPSLTIKNIGAYTVALEYDEWHSTCGFPGGKVRSEILTIRSGDIRGIVMLDRSVVTTCREGFFINCQVGNSIVRCKDVLDVRLFPSDPYR